jgi:hypothetical protein
MTDTTPCTGRRVGGSANDRDIPCPEPATTLWDGQPVCEGHREAGERREREGIAETFCEGVEIERLRAIAGAGGLVTLFRAFDAQREWLRWVLMADAAELDQWRNGELAARLVNGEAFQAKETP